VRSPVSVMSCVYFVGCTSVMNMSFQKILLKSRDNVFFYSSFWENPETMWCEPNFHFSSCSPWLCQQAGQVLGEGKGIAQSRCSSGVSASACRTVGPEVDYLNGTVGRRPQVKLRSRARHWSGCTPRPIEFEH